MPDSVEEVLIASGSTLTSMIAGLPDAAARSKAGANCSVVATVSPWRHRSARVRRSRVHEIGRYHARDNRAPGMRMGVDAVFLTTTSPRFVLNGGYAFLVVS